MTASSPASTSVFAFSSTNHPVPASTRTLLWITGVLALGVLIAGAVRTSAQIWTSINPVHAALAQSVPLAEGHEHAGNLVFVLVAVCTWLAWQYKNKSGSKLLLYLTAAALAAGCIELLTGLIGGAMHLTTLRTYCHALCGHITFACTAAAAVIASTRASEQPPAIIHSGFPIRLFAPWIPLLVVSQVAMGAAYRHNFWSIVPHMAGAVFVSFIYVAEGVILLQNAPEHRILSRVARWAIGIIIAQVALGITDFILRLLEFQSSPAWFLVSIAHVTFGSLTFAVSFWLAAAVEANVIEAPPVSGAVRQSTAD